MLFKRSELGKRYIMMKPIDIITQYYEPQSKAFSILVAHGKQVARKALAAARRVPELKPDLEFIDAAARLHDIGIFQTDCPVLGCHGKHPYLCHGILGSALLKNMGYPKLALICERHVGAGISVADIRQHKLPLPRRDMIPQSIEEQLICYADKFFSKNGNALPAEKTIAEIIDELSRYGPDKVRRFESWVKKFEV